MENIGENGKGKGKKGKTRKEGPWVVKMRRKGGEG